MASSDSEQQPQPFDAKGLHTAKKRRQASHSPAQKDSANTNGSLSGRDTEPKLPPVDEQPQPFDAKKLEPAKKRQRSASPGSDAPRKLKKPGQRARLTAAQLEEHRKRREEREREAAETAAKLQEQRGGINDVVREHYNAVPERGRDWRKTDSRIKGLRSFNNWVKSSIIQKFSPGENPNAAEPPDGEGLLVLDIGCGKGGDLGKWQQAPQRVDLYIGLDSAEVSIEQAKDRYRQMSSRGGGGGRGGRGGRGGNRGGGRPPPRLFDAFFFAKDCYGETIGDIEVIKNVGFDERPTGNPGFDIVSMMFCMHYAFESEERACMMLRNVSSALKKGGRFLGCIPNSEVIGEKVSQFNKRLGDKGKAADAEASSDDREEGEAEVTAEWGNDLYRVRFPGKTPDDGVFRPPFGWKYNFFLDEAVEEVPEYVVPWHAFRALAEKFNLELSYHQTFGDIWEAEKDDAILGPLSERMGVRQRGRGPLLVSPEEMEVANFYVAFCFYKV